MSLFANPQEHASNSPQTWQVVKVAGTCRPWRVVTLEGVHLDAFTTKREAVASLADGWAARLYAKEARWYAGESVDGWRPYAELVAQ